MKTTILFFILLYSAEANYQSAIYSAKLTDGTDENIEKVMNDYGFIIDVMDTTEISLNEKIEALQTVCYYR